jgi:hypothetical protein
LALTLAEEEEEEIWTSFNSFWETTRNPNPDFKFLQGFQIKLLHKLCIGIVSTLVSSLLLIWDL